MMYYGNGMGWFGPLFMAAGNLVFWMFLAGTAVLLIRYARQGRLPAMPDPRRTPGPR
jgi:hypothetical protein